VKSLRQMQRVVEREQAKKDTNFRWEWSKKAEKAREHAAVWCLCVKYENESRKIEIKKQEKVKGHSYCRQSVKRV